MLTILTLLFLVSLSELSEQKPNRRPQQEPEITLFPCKNCRDTGTRQGARTYRSTYLSETKTKIDDSYRQELDVKDHIIPISDEQIVLGDPKTVMKVV